MRVHTKRTLQVALVSGGLLMVGTGSASAAEAVHVDLPTSPLDQLADGQVLPGVADAVNGATGGLQAAHPVQALDTVLSTAAPQPGPVPAAGAPAAVLHTVPVHLLQHDPAPSAEPDGDQPEQNLNAPLGSELAATELPTLPLTATARPTVTPINGQLPVLPVLPVRGDVSTQPLNPTAGTRVTGLSTSVPTEAGRPGTPAQPTAVPTYGRRADLPAAGLPLLGGLLPSTNGVLPTGVPALNGVSDLTRLASLTGLTQLAGNTPLTHGRRSTTGALTAPLTQHSPATLNSPTTPLGK